LLGAVFGSFLIVIIGAFAICPFWRASPLRVAFVASVPYLFFAIASGGPLGFCIWFGAGFVVFAAFYAIVHFCRVSSNVA
jgi:hypothetical protein